MTEIIFPGELAAPARPRSQDPSSDIPARFAGVEKYGNIDAGTLTISNINASNITTGTLSADRIGANTITGTHIASNTIQADEIEAGTITTTEIAANTITAGNIAAGTITTTEIAANTITAGDIAAGTITTTEIAAGTIVAGDIAANTITGSELSTSRIDVTTMYVSGGIALGGAGRTPAIDLDVDDQSSFGGTMDLNDNVITAVKSIFFNDNSGTPADREFLMDDDGSNQRLRVHFANNATQWQVDLTAVCTPVTAKSIDPKYARKYDLMTELNDERFVERWAEDTDIQKEYRGQPKSHYPSMGNDGTAWKQHMDAMWERPWIPMRTIPDRLETMGQYPYPFVESPLIGEGESLVNFYQLVAHSYNKVMKRIEALETRVAALEMV